jgi:glc operon protein GlcG
VYSSNVAKQRLGGRPARQAARRNDEEETSMQEPVDRRAFLGRLGVVTGAIATTAALLDGGGASAQQQPAPNPLDAVPEKAPFSTPYGAPIALSRAQAALQAALDEAGKRSWPMNIAVVDSGGNLVTFARMDGAQLGSIAIAEHKARAAVRFRRPTKAFEDAVQKNDFKYILTLDDVIASRGGIPLVEDGKIIGAIGASGGTGSQDEVVALAGAATVNKS